MVLSGAASGLECGDASRTALLGDGVSRTAVTALLGEDLSFDCEDADADAATDVQLYMVCV